MLSNHTAEANGPANILRNPEAFQSNPQQQQQQPNPQQQQVAPTNVPGVKGGVAPDLNVNPNTQDPNSPANSGSDPLAQYAAKPDNELTAEEKAAKEKQAKEAANLGKPSALPTAEDFAKIGQQVASTVTPPDTELVQKALGGDAESLVAILSSQQQELIGKTLHASAVASSTLQQQASSGTTEAVRAELVETQYTESATSAAVSANPKLKEPFWQAQLGTAITELRKQYPTAPAAELGKEAANRLIGSPANTEEDQTTNSSTNWQEILKR